MKPTREGRRFIIATALIWIAAVNTGNNLIYLILSLMFSILIISIAALRLNLSRLALEITLPGHIYAGDEARAGFKIFNRKRLLPTYSVSIMLPEGMKGGVSIAHIGPRSRSETSASVLFEKRGIYRVSGFSLKSGFPFIFFESIRKTGLSKEAVVYPSVTEINDFAGLRISGGLGVSARPGGSDEMLYLRDFLPGDDIKRVSWKATAKAGRLVTRQDANIEPETFTIGIDNLAPQEAGAFEKAVSFAASVARTLLDAGVSVRLVSCSGVVPFGSGPEHLHKMLYSLAGIALTDKTECPGMADAGGIDLAILRDSESPVKTDASGAGAIVYGTDL